MALIRNARQDDELALVQIGLLSWEKAMGAVGDPSSMRESALAAFRDFVSSSWLTILVIEAHGTVAGWAACENRDDLITDFWIDPQFEGQGLGKALLADIEADIVRRGFDKARVETHAQNDGAVGFFEKQGYSVHWLSSAYQPKIDRDIQSMGLSKQLVSDDPGTYGPNF
jgi:ribosomal-protein-alanine N-acetyltransferase